MWTLLKTSCLPCCMLLVKEIGSCISTTWSPGVLHTTDLTMHDTYQRIMLRWPIWQPIIQLCTKPSWVVRSLFNYLVTLHLDAFPLTKRLKSLWTRIHRPQEAQQGLVWHQEQSSDNSLLQNTGVPFLVRWGKWYVMTDQMFHMLTCIKRLWGKMRMLFRQSHIWWRAG